MNRIIILIFKVYQKTLSPLFGQKCRFYPSCSEYAIKSFQKESFFKAIYKTIHRLVRCTPLSDGGVDLP